MAGKLTRRDRDRLTEQATRGRTTGDLREARRVFREELSAAEQHALMREIAHTRGPELCRAYKSVLTVGYGHRHRTNRRSGHTRVVHEPCVTFVVKRKWAKGETPTNDETLPACLLAYYTVDGRRRLCAVPTDVDAADDYADACEQADPGQIQVNQGDDAMPLGMLTCALRRSLNLEKTYVLSCHHVFSGDGGPTSGAKIELETTGERIGLTRPVLGKLQSELRFSLDAQLAEVKDIDAARRGLGDVRLTGLAAIDTPIPERCFILTSHGAIEAEGAKVLPNWPINYSGGRLILHDEVIVSQFASAQRTRKGDSGSPLVTAPENGLLIGMHIAGNDDKSFAIPAWDLFTPGLYSGAIRSERWELLQPEELEAPPVAPIPDDPSGTATMAGDELSRAIGFFKLNHNFNAGVRWKLSARGIHIENAAPRGRGRSSSTTIKRVWRDFGEPIRRWAKHHDVPVELIIATICTESNGRPDALREEPGFISDKQTPMKVSVGPAICLRRMTIGETSEMFPMPPTVRASLPLRVVVPLKGEMVAMPVVHSAPWR